VNIVKAQAAVEHIARQVANAMDAADRCEQRIQDARQAALQAVEAHNTAVAEVNRLHDELLAAEQSLREAQTEHAKTNGAGSGAAFNPTIRIDYPD
jgi:hypothetical protein